MDHDNGIRNPPAPATPAATSCNPEAPCAVYPHAADGRHIRWDLAREAARAILAHGSAADYIAPEAGGSHKRRLVGVAEQMNRIRDALCLVEPADALDAKRYRRLRVLGCAPDTSRYLHEGSVITFTTLDAFVDYDIETHPSRGEPR